MLFPNQELAYCSGLIDTVPWGIPQVQLSVLLHKLPDVLGESPTTCHLKPVLRSLNAAIEKTPNL